MAEDPTIPNDFDLSCDDYDSDIEKTLKIETSPYINAFLNKKNLPRDIEQIPCDENLLEKVTSNYVIVKTIISNLSWQNKLMCKNVCTMWKAVVDTLQREQIGPCDFAVNLRLSYIRNGVKLNISDNVYTEPLAVFVFANASGFTVSRKCAMLVPCPCDPPCPKKHQLVDMVRHHLVSPKNCGLTIKACYLSYMPLAQSITYPHLVHRQKFGRAAAIIAGIYIPVVRGVEYRVINVKSLADIKATFYDVIDEIAQTRIIKGALVFVNESFLLHAVEDIVFLNYLTDAQPNVPYALGGCIVEDTLSKPKDIIVSIDGVNEGIERATENLISIGVFSVPKVENKADPECQFDMYSLILESTDWSKPKIETVVNEFSKKIPHFEHSVVLKMSCVGRDQKHDYEQNCFRAAFPHTRLIGCYGNGELGTNHPTRPPAIVRPNTKRHRRDPGPQFGIMYSYSSVYVYIGWGKITKPAETNT
ncbi:unnamed protein product [Chrysodeixis includens]|uniref:Uncharacterized protein n=1 Tax=Chrysodeixis includens TaxID=689277 RepID=A0A9P0FQK6_CHRIL|nr:unnamed protein product [Chrysodeixis includens]